MTEEQMQAECFLWWHNTYGRNPKYAKRLFAVDNNISHRIKGEYRIIEGNRKKAIGVVPGVSDMVLLLPKSIAFIELKLPGNTQSDEQLIFEKLVNSMELFYFVVKSVSEFQNLIKDLLYD